MTTSVPTFNFLALLISEIKRVFQNLMWRLLAPCRILYAETIMCAQSTWQGQTASQISASYLCASCSYANMYFPYRLTIICAQKWGFEGEDVKILSSDPQKFYYSAWIRVWWCSAWQNRFNGLSSRSVKRFLRTKKEIKKLSGNFGYMGRSNPWGDLDRMWLVGRYGGRNHVCNISWLSVKGCAWVWWEG